MIAEAKGWDAPKSSQGACASLALGPVSWRPVLAERPIPVSPAGLDPVGGYSYLSRLPEDGVGGVSRSMVSRRWRSALFPRTGGRVVEGTGLENRHTGNGIVSSNLTLSVEASWVGERAAVAFRGGAS